MEETIRALAERLGIGEETAREAVALLLSFVRDNADAEKSSRLLEQLPEARVLLNETAMTNTDAGNGLLSKLGNMLGGSVGSAMQTISRLQELGLNMQQIGEVGRATFRYCRDNVDDRELFWEVMRSLREKVPGLDRFLPTERS